jgi:DNA invertase Pin-like site-specific DNA recombinase
MLKSISGPEEKLSGQPCDYKARRADRSPNCSERVPAHHTSLDGGEAVVTSTDDPQKVAIYARAAVVPQAAPQNALKAQMDACHAYAARQNFRVVETYFDHGSANSPLQLRPGLLSLLSAAKTRAFDILLVQDLDRLSRDAATFFAMLKTLRSSGIRLWTVCDGELDHDGMGGEGFLVGMMRMLPAEEASRYRSILAKRAYAAKRAREEARG